MANERNLHPGEYKFTDADREKAKKARQENLLKKKSLRDAISVWLESEVSKDKKGNPLTGTDVMVQVAIREVAKGNPRFWELVRDTAGQKPVEKVMIAEVDAETIDEIERLVMDDGE